MTSKKWQKRYDAQQRALDVPLTTGQRFTRTLAAIMSGSEDNAAIEAKWLVRAARHEQLLKRPATVTCPRCRTTHPAGQSCICFDNDCE